MPAADKRFVSEERPIGAVDDWLINNVEIVHAERADDRRAVWRHGRYLTAVGPGVSTPSCQI